MLKRKKMRIKEEEIMDLFPEIQIFPSAVKLAIILATQPLERRTMPPSFESGWTLSLLDP